MPQVGNGELDKRQSMSSTAQAALSNARLEMGDGGLGERV